MKDLRPLRPSFASMNGRVIGMVPGMIDEFVLGPGMKLPRRDFAALQRDVEQFSRFVRSGEAERKHARNQASAPERRTTEVPHRIAPRKTSSRQFFGMACRYNRVHGLSRGMGPWESPITLMPRCFQDDLRRGADIVFRSGHDELEVLASRQRGTLTLTDSPDGLFFTITDLVETPAARRFAADVNSGRLAEISTELTVLEQESGNGYFFVHRAKLTAIVSVEPGRAACPGTYLSEGSN